MKIKKLFALVILFTLILTKLSISQVMIKTTKGSEPFEIPEIAALAIESDKDIEVLAVMPKDHRPETYKNVNIEKGDRILMINGKKVTKTKDCRDIYEKLPVGGELKLGIKRNDQMFIVSINKADAKDLPQVKRRIITSDGKSGGTGDKMSAPVERRIIKTR